MMFSKYFVATAAVGQFSIFFNVIAFVKITNIALNGKWFYSLIQSPACENQESLLGLNVHLRNESF